MGHGTPADSPSVTTRRWALWSGSARCGLLELFPLDADAAELPYLSGLLSTSERARAARFLSPLHGRRFTVAHARLRQLLAVPLEMAPADFEFATGPHGKPGLAGAAAGSGLRFNLSHSDGMGLVGWSWQMDIGVDVEAWRPMRDMAALVNRYFSPAEIAAWESVATDGREAAFFNLWTRKEAYVKALGRGLSLPLDSFDVSHEGGAGARLMRPSAQAGDTGQWSLAAPDAGLGLSLAVALKAGVCHTSPEV